MELHPYLFCLSFCLLCFFLPPFEDNGLLFWVPDVLCRHSEGFCGIYSAFKCSFDEFVGEKVISPSYSSAILGPPPVLEFNSWSSKVSEFFLTRPEPGWTWTSFSLLILKLSYLVQNFNFVWKPKSVRTVCTDNTDWKCNLVFSAAYEAA